MSIKIGWDAGHGKFTAGKRCMKSLDPNETREWILNSRIVEKSIKKLKNYKNIQNIRLDDSTGNKDIPLGTRASKSNSNNVDIVISVHHNAGINGGSGGGIIVFRHPNSGKVAQELQKGIYDNLIKHTGLKGNRAIPLGTANFQILRQTKAPAILIENGYMDSKVDVPIILSESHAEKSADAIVEFLVKYFNLKSNTSNKNENNVSVTPPKPASKGNLSVDGIWGKNTTKELQKSLGTVQDGIISKQRRNPITNMILGVNYSNSGGSLVVKALQRKIGARVDGLLGPETIRRLQKYLGTVVDGKLSKPSMVVKELQRRLNNGTF